MKYLVLFFFSISSFFQACQSPPDVPKEESSKGHFSKTNAPQFNADTAFYFIEKQVAFGYRIPNSSAHLACAEWLKKTLSQYADTVIIQKADVKAFDNTSLNIQNIIASFQPQLQNRILLAAHWDSRPFSDQDKSFENWEKPIDGANDGASGVGVLLEIARLLKNQNLNLGIDIILFDAEDYGQPAFSKLPSAENSYCLGSQYWSANPHVQDYTAKYGILLDMVGAKGSTFLLEGLSMQVHPELMRKVWNLAAQLGHGNYFIFKKTSPITDDHYYVSQIAKIPMIDIISLHPQNLYSFHHTWHTQNDNLSVIDRKVLLAVGETLTQAIFLENDSRF